MALEFVKTDKVFKDGDKCTFSISQNRVVESTMSIHTIDVKKLEQDMEKYIEQIILNK